MFVKAGTPEEIDAIRAMKVKVVVADEDGNYNSIEVPLVSPELRAMVDTMCFLSKHGHKTMFESNRTRPAFRAAFAAYSLKVAIDKVDDFYSSWKDYRSRNPVEGLPNAPGAPDGEIDLDALMGGDDDDDVPVFAARPAAAAGAAGPATASAPALQCSSCPCPCGR
jgi:hypothetical protein